jgi:outer membrane murein-binding lipoprotein Lpp
VALRADKKDANTMLIRIDGKDVETTDQVAGYVKGLAARADALEAELKALPAIIRAEEQRRSDAVAVATKVGSQTTGTLAEIQAAVATKVLGVELRADSSAEYVAGCYAAALKISARDEKKVDHVDSAVDPLEAARAKYLSTINGSI